MIEVVRGIEEGDARKIIYYGGKTVYKAVVIAILEVILTPAFKPMIGAMVNYVVDRDVALVEDILKAAQRGDAVEIGEIVFKFYAEAVTFGTFCALMPENAFKDATCGNLGKVLNVLADAGEDIAKAVLGVAEDVLKAVGIYQVGDALVGVAGVAIDDFLCFFDIGCPEPTPPPPPQCGPPASTFYPNNYLACLGAAAKSSAAEYVTTSLHSACMVNFACSAKAGDICKSLDNSFSNMVNQTSAALDQGAEIYTGLLGDFLQKIPKEEMCKYGYSDRIDGAIAQFADQCASSLSKTIPLQASCKFQGWRPPRQQAHYKACIGARGVGAAASMMENECKGYCLEAAKSPDYKTKMSCQPPPGRCELSERMARGSLAPEDFLKAYMECNQPIPIPGIPDFIGSRWRPPDANTGGFYTAERGGTSYDRDGNPYTPRAPELVANFDKFVNPPLLSANPLRLFSILQGDAIPPLGVLQRRAPSGGGGFTTLQPGGTSVPGVGGGQARTPSGNTGGFDGNQRVLPGVGGAQPRAPSGNTGGFTTLQPGGTLVPGVGGGQARTPSGNTGGFDGNQRVIGTSVPGVGGGQARTPSGNTGGFDGNQRVIGTSVPGVGGAQPKTPSGSAAAGSAANTGGFDTAKRDGTSYDRTGNVSKSTRNSRFFRSRSTAAGSAANTGGFNTAERGGTSYDRTGNVSKSTRNSRFFQSRITSANSSNLSVNQLTSNRALQRAGTGTGGAIRSTNPRYRQGGPR